MSHKSRKRQVKEKASGNEELYNDWLDYLLTGFNILIRGEGSKISLVETFCDEILQTPTVITIYGHDQNISIRAILKTIIDELKLGIKLPLSITIESAKKIFSKIQSREVEGVLVIHNLDATSLRDPLMLEILSVLVGQKSNLSLIATLSSKWGDIYWNQELKRNMRFVEYTVDTNKYDEDEYYALNPKLSMNGRNPGDNHTIESLDMIWTALPTNSHRIFLTLYELIKNSEDMSIQILELLDELKKEMFTLNEQTLGQLLNEFISHSVIKKSPDGNITFCVKPVILSNFVEAKITS